MTFRVSVEDRFPTAAMSPQPTEEMVGESLAMRARIVETAALFDAVVPEGRWKSLALTALEEALMWANKGLFNQK